MSKVKAIIFDCYNVLVDDGMPAFVEEHVQDAEAKRQIWEADDAVNLGEKTVLEFFEFLANSNSLATALKLQNGIMKLFFIIKLKKE